MLLVDNLGYMHPIDCIDKNHCFSIVIDLFRRMLEDGLRHVEALRQTLILLSTKMLHRLVRKNYHARIFDIYERKSYFVSILTSTL